ncbi:hypothetical protein GCM10020331_080000 [Ectobacillus funiculus]
MYLQVSAEPTSLLFAFYRGDLVTAGMDTSYYYTRYFRNIESVAAYALENFDVIAECSKKVNELVNGASHLSDDQKFMLIHSIRSYYGSTQMLDHEGEPFWVVNEGEYRMMNTFDLTVDQLFFELKMNPWTVKKMNWICSLSVSAMKILFVSLEMILNIQAASVLPMIWE